MIEVRTNLRFVGNKVDLKDSSADKAFDVVNDINAQKQNYPDTRFKFCIHIGTTATEAQLTGSRPEFMKERMQTVHQTLSETLSGIDSEGFEHFESTRFADLVMKVYKGEV